MLDRPQATFKQYFALQYNLGSMVAMEKLKITYFISFDFVGVQCTSFTIIRLTTIHVQKRKLESSCIPT